jgi:hypothetical protein
MVKQSAVQAKVPIKNELNKSQLNFFMNSSTSDKFQVHNLSTLHCAQLVVNLSSVYAMPTPPDADACCQSVSRRSSSSTQVPGMLFTLQYVPRACTCTDIWIPLLTNGSSIFLQG